MSESTGITVKGARFAANPSGFMPPVLDGLEGWYLLNQGAVQGTSVRNLAPLKPAGTLVGTPGQIAASYLRLGGGSYVETGINAGGPCTLISVIKCPDGTDLTTSEWCYGAGGFYTTTFATYQALRRPTGNPAFPVAAPTTSAKFDVSGVLTDVVATALSVSDARNWLCMSGRATDNVGLTTRNHTAGTRTDTAGTGLVYRHPTNTFRIGGQTTTWGKPVDLSAEVIYKRALSDSETDAVVATLKATMAALHSIAV